MARYNIPLPYGLYNVFQRYWWGQGDPLYAVLSRRGHSVDWVDVEMSKAELDRLVEVAEEIKDAGEAQEKRVAEMFLRRSREYYRDFKVGASAARLADRWVREARSWTPEGRVVAIDTALSDAESHLGLLIRETPHARGVANNALKHVEIAAQIVGRDLAREMSLPASRMAARGVREAGRRLEVRTNAYFGGASSGKYVVTISQGSDSIEASLDDWETALQEARKEIKQAEWEY